MKKMSALTLFFCCNALLIFLQVHKEGKYLKLSYELQKLQTQITNLTKEHSNFVYVLHTLQQPDIIQDIAEKQLAMQPINLKNIKYLIDVDAHESKKSMQVPA